MKRFKDFEVGNTFFHRVNEYTKVPHNEAAPTIRKFIFDRPFEPDDIIDGVEYLRSTKPVKKGL